MKIEVRDATQGEKKTLLETTLYASLKEFQDKDKLTKLGITQPIEIAEREYIAIMSNSKNATYGVDKDTSYFSLVGYTIRGE